MENQDYLVDRDRGLLVAFFRTQPRTVSVDYDAYGERVDYVVADAAGRLSLVLGSEAPRVAQQFEPAVEPPLRKMFRVYRTARGCDIQPVHLFNGRARIGEEAAYAAAIQRSRDCLGPFIRERMKPGARLRWGAFGDSISALAGKARLSMNTRPNILRDLDYYFWNYSPQALESVPRFTFAQLHPDHGEDKEAGQFGARHLKVSQHWRLIEWLQARHGVEISYRNWAIGGSNSTTGLSPKGLMHMSHPERLASILDDELDVVSIATGMNELGADYTYDNLMSIGSEFKRRGTVVIFCCPLRAHPLNHHSVDAWRKSCEDIERVARDLDSACVQTRLRFEDDALLGWCSPSELGAASATSHPGIREMAEAGELAIDLFR